MDCKANEVNSSNIDALFYYSTYLGDTYGRHINGANSSVN